MNEVATRNVDVIATEINSIKEQTKIMVLYNSIEIGRRLTEVKQMLPHGQWNTWLKENVDFSPTTASNLLNIFDQYGANQMSLLGDNVKSEKYASLSYTQAVALLGVPEGEREDFIDQHNLEDMSTRELQAAIKDKKVAEKKLKELEEDAERNKIARENLFETNQTLARKQKENLKLQQQMAQEIENLKNGDADPDIQNRIDQLTEEQETEEKELEAAQKQVKELEKELKKKPIDAKTIEVIPDAAEKELDRLREQVANQPTKLSAKFEAAFNQCVNNFKSLEDQLKEIGDTDPELGNKYKTAVVGLLNQMSNHLSGDKG